MCEAADESVDRNDTVNYAYISGFFYAKWFREELLGILPLEKHTIGKLVSGKISIFSKTVVWIWILFA